MKHILLLGDGGVGKTTFVNYLKTGKFTTRYIPTVGMEQHPFEKFTLMDVAGQEKYVGETPVRYFETFAPNIVLLMFSVDSKSSYNHLEYWYEWVPEGIPIILVANKCDSENRKFYEDNIFFHKKYNLKYCEISLKNGANVDALLEYIKNN